MKNKEILEHLVGLDKESKTGYLENILERKSLLKEETSKNIHSLLGDYYLGRKCFGDYETAAKYYEGAKEYSRASDTYREAAKRERDCHDFDPAKSFLQESYRLLELEEKQKKVDLSTRKKLILKDIDSLDESKCSFLMGIKNYTEASNLAKNLAEKYAKYGNESKRRGFVIKAADALVLGAKRRVYMGNNCNYNSCFEVNRKNARDYKEAAELYGAVGLSDAEYNSLKNAVSCYDSAVYYATSLGCSASSRIALIKNMQQVIEKIDDDIAFSGKYGYLKKSKELLLDCYRESGQIVLAKNLEREVNNGK